MFRPSLVLALLALLPGCPADAPAPGDPDAPAEDAPADFDAIPALDAAVVPDAPAAPDVPGDDAPAGTDAAAFDAAEPDAPPTCMGLAAATCLLAGCVPTFDDSCCAECFPGPCADCTNLDWNGCRPFGESPCAGGCGAAPDWVCADVLPSCDGAVVTDADSCSRPGCVPAFPSGMGEPDLGAAVCVPITATTCTALCERLPPRCPTGTAAEADGGCYTDRCVPAFVCLMR